MTKPIPESASQRYAEIYLAYQRGARKTAPLGYNFGLTGDEANLIRLEVDQFIQSQGGRLNHASVYVQQNATNQPRRQAAYESHGLDAGRSATSPGLRKLAADWRAGRVKAPEFSLDEDDN